MRLLPQSLAGQMIAVTVIATVLTQSLIIIGVFNYTDNKFDKYDDLFFFEKITRTIELLNTEDQTIRDLVLETSTSDEIKFHTSATPQGFETL